METVEYRSASHEDMPRKFLDIRFSDHPTIAEKGQLRPFPAFRRGWVKGRVPCRYLGQRPKPSESYASFLSTVFKVHLSLIFLFSFFHNSVDTTVAVFVFDIYRIRHVSNISDSTDLVKRKRDIKKRHLQKCLF